MKQTKVIPLALVIKRFYTKEAKDLKK